MQVAPPVGQIWNQFWWHHLVVKFWTNTSGTTYNWPNLEPMQVALYLAGEITQVKEAIPWVRCASGNVFKIFWEIFENLPFDSRSVRTAVTTREIPKSLLKGECVLCASADKHYKIQVENFTKLLSSNFLRPHILRFWLQVADIPLKNLPIHFIRHCWWRHTALRCVEQIFRVGGIRPHKPSQKILSILRWRLSCRDRVLFLRHKISANT